MVAAVRVHKHGGPEVLTYEDVAGGRRRDPGRPASRTTPAASTTSTPISAPGLYPPAGGLPFIGGNEGAGEVVAVGPGVTEVKVGDRVGYTSALGSYAAERIMPADRLVKLPDSISYEQAAGMMLKGMTVEYLLHRTFKVQKGMNVLIHAAAGGIGLIACQWANYLGANVIGTVGSKDKAELAKANGCHHAILYRDEDFPAKVKEITGGKLCEVVYDGVGKATFPGFARLHQAARHVRELRQCVGLDRGLQHQPAAGQGLAVLHAADAQHLRRQARGPAVDRQQPVQRGRQRQGEDPGQPEICAQGHPQGASTIWRPARPRDRRSSFRDEAPP